MSISLWVTCSADNSDSIQALIEDLIYNAHRPSPRVIGDLSILVIGELLNTASAAPSPHACVEVCLS